jgi:hypothetical protein
VRLHLHVRATTHKQVLRVQRSGWESGGFLRTQGLRGGRTGDEMLRPRAAAAARKAVEPIIRTVGFCVPGDAASALGGGGGGGGVAAPGGSNAPRHQPGSPSPVIIPPALTRVRLLSTPLLRFSPRAELLQSPKGTADAVHDVLGGCSTHRARRGCAAAGARRCFVIGLIGLERWYGAGGGAD